MLDGLPIVIHVANIKNGFAVNDTLTGSVDNASGVKNLCTISAVNGISDATSTDIYKNLKNLVMTLLTDDEGISQVYLSYLIQIQLSLDVVIELYV